MKNLIGPFKSVWHFLLVNIIIGFFVSFFFNNYVELSFSKVVIGTIWSTAIFITQWLGHAYIQTLIAKRYSWMHQPAKRILFTIISVPIYAVLAYMAVQNLMTLLVLGRLDTQFQLSNWREWVIPTFIAFFISILAAAYGFFVNLKKSIIEKEKLKREMLSYKYETLRNQINPHFMFNSLNVLSDLVYEDQAAAVKFIHSFSDIYRYVLDSRDQELVPLKKELAFIGKFNSLLKVRFEDKIQFELDIVANDTDLIVPLSLQLLIENAVKHNEVSSANPLKLTLVRNGDTILVSNSIRFKNAEADSKKIGLKNLQQQFAYFTEKEIIIAQKENTFQVTLPILKQV